ncbi:hypothetical protein [Stutzerimonas xanthomarina]|uniref:hypothetical protein n=1 Tax=Stutzerimonas xanthomarina TaxID=271420 RepID=UPI0029B81F11|nr:hypothetical protein [Stutzerimonas xanthomarina]MDX2355215.1 hypothetical protein [Stutzerimonas xanthomarina]
MPKLSKFREYHYESTAKVSDNTRTLALSAIAIVWLFKAQNDGQYQVPVELQLPLFLVVLAMALDFFQYVYRSIVWHIIFRSKESSLQAKEITEETELYVNAWVNFMAYLFFYSKIGVLSLAYALLLSYFLKMVSWV